MANQYTGSLAAICQKRFHRSVIEVLSGFCESGLNLHQAALRLHVKPECICRWAKRYNLAFQRASGDFLTLKKGSIMKKLISIISICLCTSVGSAVATTQPGPASDFDTPKFKAFKEQLQQMNQRAKALDQQKANKESDYQIPSYLVNFSPEASFKVIAMGDGLYGLNAALNHTNPTAFDAFNRSAIYMQVATQTKLLATISAKLSELIQVERQRAGVSHV